MSPRGSRYPSWRLGVGAACLLLGVLAVGLGAASVTRTALVGAGLAEPDAWRVGVGAAAVLAPASLLAAGSALPAPPRVRQIGVGGAALSALGAALLVVGAPPGWTGEPSPVAAAAAVPYLVGLLVAVWAVVAGVADRLTTDTQPAATDLAGPANPGVGARTADGGDEDDGDLEFPLDDDQ